MAGFAPIICSKPVRGCVSSAGCRMTLMLAGTCTAGVSRCSDSVSRLINLCHHSLVFHVCRQSSHAMYPFVAMRAPGMGMSCKPSRRTRASLVILSHTQAKQRSSEAEAAKQSGYLKAALGKLIPDADTSTTNALGNIMSQVCCSQQNASHRHDNIQ